ncbi:MAG: Glu/Leu/Phe/Val dehydrogenase dimerization domain-containing protein [Deltaproteobacteria bacterium]|nr:Glu/Leu/Phe/Val dehydrogenase dimerization domain-containing protein [Deltaproteobacteria bacterium]
MSERLPWPGPAAEVHAVRDEASGLEAWIVLDDLTLGPAAGGIRTRGYATADAARDEAAALARMMTLKCALAGLPAGGGKGVVRLPASAAGWRREEAFEALGRFVESLEGRFRTAGDLGTGPEDLQAMARRTRWVHPEEGALAAASGRSARRCFEAIAARWGASSLEGISILVQGCGAIGGAVARAASEAGARVEVCDLEEGRAAALAADCGASVVPLAGALEREVDILSPCAVGGVIDAALAGRLRARALCGGANGILAEAEADRVLLRRGILHVPDALASAGAVVEGLGRSLMGRSDTSDLVDRLGSVAAEILEASATEGRPAGEVAIARARDRLSVAARN